MFAFRAVFVLLLDNGTYCPRFCALFKKRSASTRKRLCVPEPITPTPSSAVTWYEISLPLTPVISAVAVTFRPSGVAASWLMSSFVPTVV